MSCVLRELPRYQCHKRVCALKIRDMPMTPRGYMIIPFEPNYPPFEMTAAWVEQNKPMIGGYVVWNDGDGYATFSPADIFEAEHTLI